MFHLCSLLLLIEYFSLKIARTAEKLHAEICALQKHLCCLILLTMNVMALFVSHGILCIPNI